MLSQILTESLERGDSYKRAAAGTLSRGPRGGGGVMPYAGATGPFNPFDDQQLASAIKQYHAGMKDHPWSAIRPVCVTIADLPFRCGTQLSRGTKPSATAGKFRAKAMGLAPPFVRKQLAEGMEQDDSHPLLDVFEDPNPIMGGWQMLCCTAHSIEVTGRSYWWIQDYRGREAENRGLPLQLWYLPSTWVKPIHSEDRPFAGWRVKPPSMTEQEAEDKFGILSFEEVIYFAHVDPSDPFSSMSPMQTQAKAINTDDEIQKAQFASMLNGIHPGVVISAGRIEHPSMTGPGLRPLLTPEQRTQLINAVRLAYAGTQHMRDPIIVDAMIESVTPYTNSAADLDFPNGSKLTKDRIYQGIGTSQLVAGHHEDANRSTSYTQHEIFYKIKVNPIATMMSQAMTKWLGPLFAPQEGTGKRFYIWLEKAKAQDADLKLKELEILAANQCLTKNQMLEACGMAQMETGGDEIAGPPQPPVAPPGMKPQSATRKPGKKGGTLKRKMAKILQKVDAIASAAALQQPKSPLIVP